MARHPDKPFSCPVCRFPLDRRHEDGDQCPRCLTCYDESFDRHTYRELRRMWLASQGQDNDDE